MTDGDSLIIRRVLDGETNAFADLIHKYEGKVARLCASILRDRYSEDAVQEIFLKSYRSLAQFKSESAFSTWLYRIAHNHCLNLLRKSKSERTVSMESILEKSGANDWAEPDRRESFELKRTAQELLSKLTEDERSILTLREVEGLSYRELAETFELSVEAVKSRLFRARQSMIAAAKVSGLYPSPSNPETK